MNQHPNAGDDQNHYDRELVQLERRVDMQISDGHPGEVTLHEWRVRVSARAAHRDENPDRERESEHHDAGSDDAGKYGEAMPYDDVMVVSMCAPASYIVSRVLLMPFFGGRIAVVRVRAGITRPGVKGTRECQQAIEHEPEQR
jgi:hypothetical protein